MLVFSQADAITKFLDTEGLKHASIGLCVKDLTGKVIASHDMRKSYTPASTLKVITTASAFEILGADYRYRTTLAIDKGNPNRLIIHGYGDPTLGTAHLGNEQYKFVEVWVNEILKAFAGKPELEILVIDNYFGYNGISRKWIHEDIGNYYAAGAYGISVFDNTYELTLNTMDRSLGPQIVATKPYMKDIVFTNTLGINTTGKDNGYILGAPFSKERTIIGDVPANRNRFTIKGDIPDPGLYLGNVIANALSGRGIYVKEVKTTRETFHEEMYKGTRTVYNEEVFHTHYSPVLPRIAKDVNVRSNNHYAEHLIRTIGRVKDKDIYSLALEGGIEAINDLWKSKGISTDALFMYDGSGLAPSNAVSSELMSNILVYMQAESKHASAYLNTFPISGKNGTARNFLKGTRLEGKVYVKSGSIAGVQCFAGYYIEGNKKYAFTIMVNNFSAPRRDVVKAIERLLLNVLV